MLPPDPPDLMGDTLAQQFIVAPFTVLRAPEFNARCTAWKKCLDMPMGFGGGVEAGTGGGGGGVMAEFEKDQAGTSTFNPAVAEIHYWWFCPKGGQILDPFAGSWVRGMVAAWRGYSYIGVDLRQIQVDANYAQLQKAPTPEPSPTWVCGDSTELTSLINTEGEGADYIFSSPPYAGLEKYSDDPRDLNNMTYDRFLYGYRSAIHQACSFLKPNRFATFVVGEVRNKDTGGYKSFVHDTVRAFEDAGLMYYNEAILVTSSGSVGSRISYPFATSRKLGKIHQNLLTFVKGDPQLAAEACCKDTYVELRALTGQIIGKSAAKAVFDPELVKS